LIHLFYSCIYGPNLALRSVLRPQASNNIYTIDVTNIELKLVAINIPALLHVAYNTGLPALCNIVAY
jgi:hypothetical protein